MPLFLHSKARRCNPVAVKGRIRQSAAWTDKIGIQPGLWSMVFFARVYGVANGRSMDGLRVLSAQPVCEEKTMRKQGERS
jgi:hypothetical protein